MIVLFLLLMMFEGVEAGAGAPTTRPFADDLVAAQIGDLPIILSAPHGGQRAVPDVPVRRGVGVRQFVTQRDNNTAELTRLIGAKLSARLSAKPFTIVAEFERKYIDANRAPENAYESTAAKAYYEAYHRALADSAEKLRRQWGFGIWFDIHGQTADSESIYRGTNNRKSVTALEQRSGIAALIGPRSVLGQMQAQGYKVLPELDEQGREKQYTGGYTTQVYGSHRGTKIDVMQLELGGNLRKKATLDRTAEDLAQAIAIFAKEYLPLLPARR
ncbi:MAG TPA: hypothetical protein VMT22_00745 [Terriglobales bacterium]|jgi:N-formylglutamate amidohydrolase|nr:hypothetical protein [Terriglobales bacterium]